MRLILSALSSASLAIASLAHAAPNHLQPPAAYDNAGNGVPYGQTFIAVQPKVFGVKFYVGDPTRPDEPCCDEMLGRAFLVLYDAANLNAPVLLARHKVQSTGQYSFGVSTYCFVDGVTVVPGRKYFIAIESDDGYGLGLRSLNADTYLEGSEAVLLGGSIVDGVRDTSFNVLSKACGPNAS